MVLNQQTSFKAAFFTSNTDTNKATAILAAFVTMGGTLPVVQMEKQLGQTL